MRLIKDIFLVKANKDLNKTLSINGHDGNPLFLDTDFNKYENSTQVGEIESAPMMLDEKYAYDVPLKKGDKVIFHHFVVQPDNKVADSIYRCDYFHLWCKVENDKVMPLEDFIFVDPILEPEESMFKGSFQIKVHREVLKNQGVVFALSNKARAKGLKEGDKVFFTNDANYDIKIIDRDLYRMRLRNIIGVERDGKLICLSNKCLVMEHKEDEKVGGLILPNAKPREKTGVVVSVGSEIKGIEIGDEVSYFHGLSSKLNYNGEAFAFLTKDNINYILETT